MLSSQEIESQRLEIKIQPAPRGGYEIGIYRRGKRSRVQHCFAPTIADLLGGVLDAVTEFYGVVEGGIEHAIEGDPDVAREMCPHCGEKDS